MQLSVHYDLVGGTVSGFIESLESQSQPRLQTNKKIRNKFLMINIISFTENSFKRNKEG